MMAWFSGLISVFIHLKLNVMPLDRSIGSTGLEQGGPNLGNDYSRDITREVTSDDKEKIIIPKKDEKHPEKKDQNKKDKEQEQH